ncbi:MAG: VCBS repeat-containing protein, partial [Acidobacteriota bacterium]|nr:VCBS repeat-containing protein [Acidobacteriota bacterium]
MNRQSSAHVTAFNRASVIVVLIALLAPPLMLLTDLSRSSAKGKRPKAAANTAPPPAYDFSSKAPGIASNLIERVSEKTNAAWEYVTAPELPEGFENATPVSPLYESVSSAIGSVTSLGSPPRASAATLAAGDVSFDFEGDGKADAARWNPGSFEYLIKKSNGSGYQTETIGTSVSTPVPGDFDADGKTDAATFTAGLWTVRKSSGGADVLYNWGVSGDVPVAGDYDGDGKSDYAIVRTETSGSKTWWIHNSATGGYSTTSFGTTGDILVPGNYDGDSQTDIAVFRGGVWHVLGSSAGYYTFGWGVASDTPVPADYDADGKTDFAIFRPGTGTWWVYYSNTSTYLAFGWGNYGDQPVPADYDGDNKADYAVWRPTTGVWYIHESSTGTFKYESLGLSGDTPAEAAYLKKVGSLHSKYDFAKDRLAPINAAGGTNLYSRNFSWGAALVALPGRAGFNAGFGISYNSLVWTKDTENDVMVFDPDVSNVSPGFRMGFATIEPAYYDKGNGRFSFLMVTPSGARVEFKQIGATSRYETQDSTYALLELDVGDDPNDPPDEIGITVTTTDGTRTAYEWKAGAFRAKEIKDRNGNYVLVAHDEYGLLDTVTDTLGRIIEVHYDYELYPTSVTQQWKTGNGAGSTVTHTYATFTYGDIQVDPDFDSSLGVFGPDGGTDVKSLTRVTYADSSATEFDYNDYGQVEKVTNKAPDSHILNYTSTNLDTPGTGLSDVPRFSETRNWVENFNIVSGSEQEVVYTNTFTTGQTIPDVGGTGTLIQVSMTGHPTSNTSKTYVGETGWMESLPIISEDWADSGSGLTRKRWSTSLWTQDDTNLAYINNPRVTETKIGDDEIAAVRRSTTEYRIVPYTNIAEYGLVESVKVYDSDQSTVLMEVQTDYNLSSAYTDRRIIGLPSEVRGYGFENSQLALVSKVTYGYDEENFTFETNQVPNIGTGHDATNYGSAFVTGRANLTSATRHDVTGQTASVTSKTRYDIAGSPVASLDPLNRKVRTEYTDNFNDASNPGTFAYPTKVIDPAGEYSRVQYRFDIGANVWADSPHPSNSQNRGKETTRAYDSLGRLERQTLVNTGAYTRYVYPSSQVRSEVYTTIVDTNGNGADSADEVLSESLFDGAGRTLQSRTEHPGSTGGFAGSIAEYNKLGQLKRSTVPTEITSSYTPTGDDTSWLWQEKEYDWNGRVVREINTDGTDRLISYSGCGCAGITETTIESESVPRDDIPTQNARRKQKVYTDILGRNFKTEIYNWTGGVYTTTVQTFNGRDQVISTEQFEGTANPANTKQTVTTTYDGHGRMKTRHYPIEDSNAYTEWNYNSDDTVHQLIDPRLVIKQFTYEAERGLLEKIEYLPPAGI